MIFENNERGDIPLVLLIQCLKTRHPVKTIAMLCSLAAWMTSSSLMDPPGWMIAVTPALAASSTPSLKGKNASYAITQPWVGSLAFMVAIFAESTRLIWPAPIPTARSPFT